MLCAAKGEFCAKMVELPQKKLDDFCIDRVLFKVCETFAAIRFILRVLRKLTMMMNIIPFMM